MDHVSDHKIPQRMDDDAVSAVVGVILMVFLVVALSGVMYVIIYGLIFPVEKTAYVVTDAQLVNSSDGVWVLSLIHRNGDVMEYAGMTQNPRYEVLFMVETEGQVFPVMTDPALLSDSTWSPGDHLYFFRNATGFLFTDNRSQISSAISYNPGPVSIRVVDNTHHQLVATPQAGMTTPAISPTPSPTPVPTTVTPTPSPTPVPTTVTPTPSPTPVPTTVTPTPSPTPVPTTVTPTPSPTPVPTTVTPTPSPTPFPTPNEGCVNCAPGQSFTVAFTTQVLGVHKVRFKDASSPQPNLRAWLFGDGGSASGELVDHTFPAAGTYLITLTVKKNNNPCTCTRTQWITVN